MPEPPPPSSLISIGTSTLAGCLFFSVMAVLGIWSVWQRRHAWGFWESPTTTGVILISAGGLFCTPVFFWRHHISWWGHSYMMSAILVFSGLASFALTLKRRQPQAPTTKQVNVLITAPTIVGITVVVFAYIQSGAWRNPELLDPSITGLNVWVRLLWTTVAVTLGYLLSIIAHQLLELRADTRRGDRAAITIYLASCFAGMGLAVIAVATASGYGSQPALIVNAAILFGIMTGGNLAVGGASWRRKVNQLSAPDPLPARVD